VAWISLVHGDRNLERGGELQQHTRLGVVDTPRASNAVGGEGAKSSSRHQEKNPKEVKLERGATCRDRQNDCDTRRLDVWRKALKASADSSRGWDARHAMTA